MNEFFTHLWQKLTVATLCSALLIGGQIAAIGSLTMTQTACSTSQIITDVERFLPAVLNIITVVSAFNGVNYSNLQAKVQQDAVDVEKLVQDYQQTNSVGIWNNLNAAFTVFEQDASTIFQLANIVNGNAQNKVLLMVGAAQTLLAIIESLVPPPPASVANQSARMFATHAPTAKLTLGQWVDSYNKTIAIKTGDAKVDKLKLKQIHIHSWVVRQVTFHRAS